MGPNYFVLRPLAICVMTFVGALCGCGSEADSRQEGSALLHLRLVLEEAALPAASRELLIQSGYNGELEVYAWDRWPLWGLWGTTSQYVNNFVIKPVFMPPSGINLTYWVPAGSNWIGAIFTPTASKKYSLPSSGRRPMGFGLDQLTSTGLCTAGCEFTDDTCTRTCSEYEPGKGVPFVHVDAEEDIGSTLITVRINDQITLSQDPAAEPDAGGT